MSARSAADDMSVLARTDVSPAGGLPPPPASTPATASSQLGRAPTASHRRRRWSLRRRTALAGASGALVVAGLLSLATHLLVRDYVVNQRVSSATRQALANARVVRDRIGVGAEPSGALLASARTDNGGVALLLRGGEWFSSSAGAGPNVLPESVANAVAAGTPGRQRSAATSATALYVVVPLRSVDAVYVEVFPLRQAEQLLAELRNALLAGALVAGAGGAALGAWSGRRALRPLADIGRVATAVADGHLDQRLEPTDDPDLRELGEAFNRMTDELTERIEREARFASDVSHELRTPLTSLALAIATLERRRDELPERSQRALEIVARGVADLERLVEELLELARLDAGVPVERSPARPLADLVRDALVRHAAGHVPLIVADADLGTRMFDGGTRIDRITANLVDNADRYAGGLVSVTVAGDAEHAELWFDDAGPGIPADERERLLGRFARGAGTQHIPGSGLGLALVREHARGLGGDVRVEDRVGGGCRVVVTIPWGRS